MHPTPNLDSFHYHTFDPLYPLCPPSPHILVNNILLFIIMSLFLIVSLVCYILFCVPHISEITFFFLFCLAYFTQHNTLKIYPFFKKVLFIFREGKGGRKRGRETSMCERHIDQQVASLPSQLGTWPATQVCPLAWNRTGDLLVHRTTCKPVSHTSQGYPCFLCTLFPAL